MRSTTILLVQLLNVDALVRAVAAPSPYFAPRQQSSKFNAPRRVADTAAAGIRCRFLRSDTFVDVVRCVVRVFFVGVCRRPVGSFRGDSRFLTRSRWVKSV